MRLKTLFLILALAPDPVFAYIGPGAGIGAIATLVAISMGVVLLIAGFLWYPVKRSLRKRRAKSTNEKETSSGDAKE